MQSYLANRDTLLRFLTGLCRDATLAEDVLQDLYIQAGRADVAVQVDNPLGYLFRMANNLYLNRLRAQASHRARDAAWYDLHPQQDTGADASPDAEAALSRRQDLEAVLKAVDELPERTRDIFRLHKVEGLAQAEVARRFDISLSAVEKHLGRALKHLMALRRSHKVH